MVRLKAVAVRHKTPLVQGFNSLMVRLKAVSPVNPVPAGIEFQFPNGSIKSCRNPHYFGYFPNVSIP